MAFRSQSNRETFRPPTPAATLRRSKYRGCLANSLSGDGLSLALKMDCSLQCCAPNVRGVCQK
ncbi:MAG: hypothetical protein EAZ43_01895 [Betaproteobacteria bacterium]|nr:MAG: hypothetical protein EAZ43_01895 [Betaproteobacteria bacterium]